MLAAHLLTANANVTRMLTCDIVMLLCCCILPSMLFRVPPCSLLSSFISHSCSITYMLRWVVPTRLNAALKTCERHLHLKWRQFVYRPWFKSEASNKSGFVISLIFCVWRIDLQHKKIKKPSYKYKLWPVEMQKSHLEVCLCGRWELVSLQGRLCRYCTNLWILTRLVIVLQSFFSFFFVVFFEYSDSSTPLG